MLDSRLQAFITVIEQGSFTRAAEKLHLSKARVSQQVSLLEEHLGVTLIHRSTRSLRLTNAGESFFQESQRAAQLLTQAEKRLEEDQTHFSGQIRINSVGGIFAEQILTPALNGFLHRYPQISLQVDFSSNRVDLLADNYDLVFRMGELEDSLLIARPLTQVKTYVVASPDYLAKYRYPVHPRALVKHQCLCGSVNKWRFEQASSRQSTEVVVQGKLASGNGHILRQAALDGLGIVRLNHWYLEQDLAEGRLVHVFEDWQVPSPPLSLIYRQVKYQTKRIQLLVDYLVEYFRPFDDFSNQH